MFLKDNCVEEKVDAVLVSLDAKKAFDSVDHGYIERTLRKYGFGPKFIYYNCRHYTQHGSSKAILNSLVLLKLCILTSNLQPINPILRRFYVAITLLLTLLATLVRSARDFSFSVFHFSKQIFLNL